MPAKLDAVVALSCEFSEDLTTVGPGTMQRMDTAIEFVKSEDRPLVVAGNYPFRWRTPPPWPLAHLMKDYALREGIPDDMIVVQDKSLDTVGDALFTKIEVTELKGWRNLAVVTHE